MVTQDTLHTNTTRTCLIFWYGVPNMVVQDRLNTNLTLLQIRITNNNDDADTTAAHLIVIQDHRWDSILKVM